jgi:hypothetical protein
MFEPGMPKHIQESRDRLIREFQPRGRTPQVSYADGWADALRHSQPEVRRLKKLLKDLQRELTKEE